MASGAIVWIVIFAVSAIVFFGVAAVVAVGGLSDLKKLLRHSRPTIRDDDARGK